MNMQQLIQESQRIQRNYQKELAVIEDGEYEFTANGAIKAVLKGTFELVSIEILDGDLLSSDNKEMVEDLIKIAINGAKDKIDSEVDKLNEKYSQYGLGR